jgi:hypothetical protein
MSELSEGAVCPECGHARGLHEAGAECSACLLGGLVAEAQACRDEVLEALGEFRVALVGYYRVSGSGSGRG